MSKKKKRVYKVNIYNFEMKDFTTIEQKKNKYKKEPYCNNVIQDTVEEQMTDSEKESRRSNRVATVLAVSALLIGGYAGFWRICRNAVNIFPDEGLAYGYACVFVIILCTCLILLSYRLIQYLYAEFQRYNILNKTMKNFDEKSDLYYDNLLRFLKTSLYFMVILCISVMVVSVIDISDTTLLKKIIGCAISIICILLVSVIFWKKEKKDYNRVAKVESNEKVSAGKRAIIKEIFKRISEKEDVITFALVAVAVGGLLYVTLFQFMLLNRGTIILDFNHKGLINVECKSRETLGIDVILYEGDENSDTAKSIEYSELLIAEESLHFIKSDNSTKSKGIPISELWIYSNYNVNLVEYIMDDLNDKKGVIQEGEIYALEIICSQSGDQILVKNQFIYNEGKFRFGTDKVEKDF